MGSRIHYSSPHVYPVETEQQVRPISLTADLSRDYNKWFVSQLLPIIMKKMDPAQMGGLKGNSITQTLILFYHFVVSNLDQIAKEHKSVLAAYIDLERGFHNIDHSQI